MRKFLKTNRAILNMFIAISFLSFGIGCSGASGNKVDNGQLFENGVVTGANQISEYIEFLKDKNVGICANNTSVIGNVPILDSLISLGINVVKAFGPEHGFRGLGGAGARISDEIDSKTGVPIISLFGTHYKPTPEEMKGLDVVVFDMQDVGVRFYTYSSTLFYMMEACAENNVKFILLDRPNPLGNYVDGPVLDSQYKSFVGLNPIPVVHGLTFGEYARMINGESWLNGKMKCDLTVVKMKNFNHNSTYSLPIPPSPNLNTQQSIQLYPSLCFFEGTDVSEGRGTMEPFTMVGSPELKGEYEFSFTPEPIRGMSERPKHLGEVCYGIDLRKYNTKIFNESGRINLGWLIELYSKYPTKDKFFARKEAFDRLAGTSDLRLQIIAGKSEEEIQQTWEPALTRYKEMRKKYLLY